MRTFLASCLVCLAVASAQASSPTLGGILPRGAQRGTDAGFLFNGARLSDAKEVIFYYPGVTVSKLEVVNDSQVKVTAKIAPDCRLGEHAVRLRTATGITELRTFWVGALPCIDEKEPNSDFTAPQKIPLNVTVHGIVDTEDVDYYQVECKKGQRLSVEIEAMRLGETMFDPYIAILDRKRFELATCDDAPLLGQDAACSIIVPEDGPYIIQVRDSAYAGNGACRYRLHVGTFPRPTAVVPAGGKLGEEVEVTFYGDPTGPIKQKVKLPATPPVEPFGLFPQDAGGIAPSPLKFRLSDFGNVLETPNNQSQATATPVPGELPVALNGVIAKPGETDHYRFKAKKGQTYDVHCYARRIGSALDSVMYIYQFKGGALIGNDDAVGPDSYFRWTAPADGEYVLTVTDHLGKGGPNYFYRVEFTPVRPKLTVTIPKIDIFGYSQERQTIAVPRGNRFACLINATRTDFGGDLVLGADGLPRGLKMETETMAANMGSVPVVFEAAPDAPVAGTLAHITARHADAAQKISGGFEQTVVLVGVPNQGTYWVPTFDRAAAAVTDEVPFKIQIVEPKVPLVQNGSMNLRIVAERKPGFMAEIHVYPLFNPPGIGSAGEAVIPAGKNETVLAMNASPGTQARKWKIAVLGTATVGNGPAWVSSQLATLEVAPPYVAFNMERAAAEQGKTTDLFCKIQQNTPFAGKAVVKLLGLPPKVTAPDVEITKDTKEVAFNLTLDPAAPAGTHNNIFCQVFVVQNGETVLHNVGGTQLRVDVPLVKAPAPAPKPAAVAQAPPQKPPEKRLTRLEQLRLEQQEREKMSQGGPKVAPKK
jgi:hypothetical protein